MEFNIVDDDAIFLLKDKRNGMYFKRFAYDTNRKTEVTDKIEKAKKFNNKSEASDYILTHNIGDHFNVEPINV